MTVQVNFDIEHTEKGHGQCVSYNWGTVVIQLRASSLISSSISVELSFVYICGVGVGGGRGELQKEETSNNNKSFQKFWSHLR